MKIIILNLLFKEKIYLRLVEKITNLERNSIYHLIILRVRILSIFLLFPFVASFAQKNQIPTLQNQLYSAGSDTIIIDISTQLIDAFSSIDLDSSVFYFEKAFELSHKIKDTKRLVKAQNRITALCMDKGKYDTANFIIDRGLALGHQLNNDLIIGESLWEYTRWHWELSNLKEALENLKLALNYSEKTNDLKFKARILNSFGLLNGEMGNFDEEVDFHLKSYTISKQLNDTLRQAISLNNLGFAYYIQKNYQKALYYLNQSIPLAKNIISTDPGLYELSLSLKGQSLIGLGDEELGYSFLESALELATQNKHARNQVIINKNKAKWLFRKEKYDETIQTAKTSVAICKETNYIKELPEICAIIAQSYKAKQDYKPALLWFDEEKSARQELVNRQKDKELIKMEAKYQLQQKEVENQVLVLKNKNQRTFFALLITISLMLFLLLLYFFKKKQQQKLELFRQRIAADLHDDVGSNLNNITRIAKGLKSNNNNQDVNDGIDQLVTKSNDAIRNVVDVIWALDYKESKLEDLIEKMENILDPIRLNNENVEVSLIEDNINKDKILPLNVKHHLLMIFKEAINNVQKHTFPTSIKIRLKDSPQFFQMEITNHFDKRKTNPNSTGRGIFNIKKRVKDMNGTVNIQESKNSFSIQIRLK